MNDSLSVEERSKLLDGVILKMDECNALIEQIGDNLANPKRLIELLEEAILKMDDIVGQISDDIVLTDQNWGGLRQVAERLREKTQDALSRLNPGVRGEGGIEP